MSKTFQTLRDKMSPERLHKITQQGEQMMSSIEEQIQAKGLNAPRVTPADVNLAIKDIQYHVFEGTTLTVCCLTLQNGFNVTGESAAVSLENFDQGIGQQVAYEDAKRKIWPLLGYALKDRVNRG